VTVDGQSVGCLAPPAQAALSITDTLAYGCPAPLAALGNSLGAAGLAKLFTQFQFFTAPGLVLPTTAPTADKSGTFPDASLAGIGQAGLTVTPLQMALVTAALVDHGQMPIPQLVLQTQNPAMGWQSTPLAPPVPVLDAAVADQVKAMLGAGQTATAVTGANGKTLAWYAGFGPFDQPQVVVAVLLEDGSPQAARDIGQTLVAAAIRP
jgi:peptidoglycan glycosyltransferase